MVAPESSTSPPSTCRYFNNSTLISICEWLVILWGQSWNSHCRVHSTPRWASRSSHAAVVPPWLKTRLSQSRTRRCAPWSPWWSAWRRAGWPYWSAPRPAPRPVWCGCWLCWRDTDCGSWPWTAPWTPPSCWAASSRCSFSQSAKWQSKKNRNCQIPERAWTLAARTKIKCSSVDHTCS